MLKLHGELSLNIENLMQDAHSNINVMERTTGALI